MGLFPFTLLNKPAKADVHITTQNRPDNVTVKAQRDPPDEYGRREVGSVTLPKPKFHALPFTSIGAISKEVLYGAKGTGLYVLDHKASFTTRTAAGTVLSGSALRQGDGISATVSGTHAFPQAGTTLTCVTTSSGSAEVDVAYTVAPGLRASLMGIASPGPLFAAGGVSGKLGAEYGNQYVHAKGSASLEAQPVLNLSVATGAGQLQFGFDAAFSTSRAMQSARTAAADAAAARASRAKVEEPGSNVAPAPASSAQSVPPSRMAAMDAAAFVGGFTRWTAALGYKHLDQHYLALMVSDAGSAPLRLNTKLTYAMKVQEGIFLAAEAARDMPVQGANSAEAARSPVSFTVGVQAQVAALQDALRDVAEDNGVRRSDIPSSNAASTALVKLKVDNKGLMSALYTDKLLLSDQANSPALQVTWAAQLDTLNPLARAPKLGISLDLV